MARHGTARHGIMGVFNQLSPKEDTMEEGVTIFRGNFSKDDIIEGKPQEAILNALNNNPDFNKLLFNAAQATLVLRPPFLDDQERSPEDLQKLLEDDGYTVIVSVGHMKGTKELKQELFDGEAFADIASRVLETWVKQDEWKARLLTFGAPTTSRS